MNYISSHLCCLVLCVVCFFVQCHTTDVELLKAFPHLQGDPPCRSDAPQASIEQRRGRSLTRWHRRGIARGDGEVDVFTTDVWYVALVLVCAGARCGTNKRVRPVVNQPVATRRVHGVENVQWKGRGRYPNRLIFPLVE